MKVEPFLREGEQQYIDTPHHDWWGSDTLSGWVTDDGCMIFTTEIPRFHPQTGKELET